MDYSTPNLWPVVVGISGVVTLIAGLLTCVYFASKLMAGNDDPDKEYVRRGELNEKLLHLENKIGSSREEIIKRVDKLADSFNDVNQKLAGVIAVAQHNLQHPIIRGGCDT